jgi:phage-related protein
VDELSQKFTLITRSTSSYQSSADQFSGVLPATSAGFLEQAQAAGILSDKYTQLTQVPIAEYQAAVSQMLQQGVAELGLANNTMNEAFSTLSGSLSMAKGAWSNLVTGLADDSADLDMLIGNFVESVGAVAENLIPTIGKALNGAVKLVKDIIPVIISEIPPLITDNLPILAEAAIGLIQGLADGLMENKDVLVKTILDVAVYLVESVLGLLPKVLELGIQLVLTLANGLSEAIPSLLPTVVDVIIKIIETLLSPESLTNILSAALTLVVELSK